MTRWAYGVTTVPSRRSTLLPRTLASLAAAGFGRPRLFVDGDGKYDLPTTHRCPAVGAFGNWYLALLELAVREPSADRLTIFQDDVLAVKNLRDYLDSCRYPANGYWNLFTFLNSDRVVVRPGWVEGPTLNSGTDPSTSWQCGRGALALVFSREAAWQLLSSPSLVQKPASHDHPRDKIDGAVVTAMNIAGYREFVHGPSLVQHIGTETSIQEPGKAGKVWQSDARTFPGEVDILAYMRDGAR